MLGEYGSIVQLLPMDAATVFWYRATAAGAIAGLIAGIGCNYLITFGAIPSVWFIHPGLVGLVANDKVLTPVFLLNRPINNIHVAQYINI